MCFEFVVDLLWIILDCPELLLNCSGLAEMLIFNMNSGILNLFWSVWDLFWIVLNSQHTQIDTALCTEKRKTDTEKLLYESEKTCAGIDENWAAKNRHTQARL